jgi:hypothetical protein
VAKLRTPGGWNREAGVRRNGRPMRNSKFKIQDDLRLEISERSQEVNRENGKSKPRIANHKSAIGHRQSTNCHRAGLGSAKAAKRKNSFFRSIEAGMLLKTNKTRTKCMARERTFSAKLLGLCRDQAQFSPLLAGESRCFGRKTRHGSASNGAS